jgi:hypothetical protein
LINACGGSTFDSGAKVNIDLKKVKEIIFQYPSLLNDGLFGYTSLMISSLHNSLSVVEFLLSCDGIEVNKQNGV